MSDQPRSPGKTTIDPGVLLTIARLTTLSIEGVEPSGRNSGWDESAVQKAPGSGCEDRCPGYDRECRSFPDTRPRYEHSRAEQDHPI